MKTLVYSESSESIRQMPENYLIAHKQNGAWICNPDLSANSDLCVKVFRTIIYSYANKYTATGQQIIDMALKLN